MNDEIEIEELAPWLVIFFTFIGGGLRLFLLGKHGLWLDEALSVWFANHPIGEMLPWVAKLDQHPPLYYMLLHSWIFYNGDTPYYVRLLSALFGAGTIPFIYLIGKRLSGEGVGLMAAILLALSPFNIRLAQEARMYSLLMFNVAVAMYALVRLLTDSRTDRALGSQFWEFLQAGRSAEPLEPDISERDYLYRDSLLDQPGWRGWLTRQRYAYTQRLSRHPIDTDMAWVAFIIFSAATMWTHNTAVLFVLATNLFVFGLILVHKRQKSETPSAFHAPAFANWLKAQVGILLLWSPWGGTFLQQARSVYEAFWLPQPSWDHVLRVLKAFLNENPLGPSSQSTVLWFLYALVLCFGVVYYRKRIGHFLFLATLFAIPILGELLVSIWRPIFYDRTLIWTTLPLLLLLAAGLVQLKPRVLIFIAIGIFSTINLFSIGDYYRFTIKEDWDTAAGYVANFAEKDDLVLFNSPAVQIPFDYYFKEYEKLYLIQVQKHGIPIDMLASESLSSIMTEENVPQLITLLSGHNRVWLVYSHNWYTDPTGLIPQTLASQMQLARQRDFWGGQVQLYEAP